MDSTFNLAETIKTGLITSGLLLPFNIAVIGWLGGAFGVKGRGKLIASMIVGMVFGGSAMYLQINPTNFAGWFSVLIVGVSVGLVSSGLYDVQKGIAEKAASKAVFNSGD